MSSLEPCPRNSFFSAANNFCFYVWGGYGVPADDLQYLYVFKSETEAWNRSLLTGPSPPGVLDGASAMIDQCLYVYGGLSRTGNRTGSLFELNIASLSWNEASPPVAGGPQKKSSCGMVNCDATLIIFGGETTLVHYTNELHVYDTVTGTWSSPRFTGRSPPPCSCFTFTEVSHYQVVVHGGVGNDGTYMLDLSTMHWTKFRSYLSETTGLHGHAALCLGLKSDYAQLLVLGGLFTDYVWLLDVATESWMKLSINNEHLIRLYHGAAVVQSTTSYEEVVIFGGLKNASVLTAVAKTTLLRFKKRPSAPHDVLWWHLTDLIPVTQLGMKEKHGWSFVRDVRIETTRDSVHSDALVEELINEGNQSTDTSLNTHGLNLTENAEEQDNVNEKREATHNKATGAEPQDFFDDVMKAVAESLQIRKKMANIILQGLPGSGKTSLLDRLLNRPIRSYYCSTGISETIVIVDISPTSTLSAAHAYDDSTWKVIDFDTSLVAQLDYCMKFIPGQVKQSSQEIGSDHQDLETDLCKIHLSSDVEDHVKEVLREYDIKNIKDLQAINSLYIRDTGGQVEFQESLSLLIYGPSIFIFVMKTNIDINTKHIIQYRSPTQEIMNKYKSSISTLDALLQFLTSVSAIQTTKEGVFQKEDGAYISHKPVVFIVGTHIDQLGSETTSVIDKMNSDLDKLIRAHSFLDLVHYADGELNKVMYLVNNTSDEDHNFQVLRSSINRFISTRNEFTIEYPVSYLLFCLELQSIKKTVISMDECITLAAMFGIQENDIQYLLHFLQFRVGIIQHYNVEGLSDLIIKEPQVLFNKVTDLIVLTFLSSGSLNMSQQDSFRKKGILEACAFDNVLSKEDKITSKQFLCFLLHLRMAVPFTDKKGILKYFIPSVLNHVPIPLCSKNKTNVAPLAITFESGHCPKGLLSMMVSYLLNPEKSQEVTFDLLEDKIYQDQVSLRACSTEDIDEVCIKRYLSHLEIKIFFEKSSADEESQTLLAPRANTPTKVCGDIRIILNDCLLQSLEMLHYDSSKIGPMFCVACPQENCEQFHEVKGFHYMHCSTDKETVKLQLPKSAVHWFKEGIRETSSSSSKKNSKTLTETNPYTTGHNSNKENSTPSAAEVTSNQSVPDFCIKNLTLLKWTNINGHTQSIRIRDELSAKWQEVGDLLGLKASYLETLDTQYRGDARIICRRILLDWIQKNNERSYPVSWDGLLCLLEDMQLTTLAMELKTALKCQQ